VNWYAANPGFHPIPVGYGLPWGTCEEEHIPAALVRQAEFELAREQLATQTPELPPKIDSGESILGAEPDASAEEEGAEPPDDRATQATTAPRKLAKGLDPAGRTSPPRNVLRAAHSEPVSQPAANGLEVLPTPDRRLTGNGKGGRGESFAGDVPSDLPSDWPDPRGFVPRPPSPQRPDPILQTRPVITHTRLYDGANSDVTEALANYVYYRDDARFGGWQAYLQRSDDFIRFCCYLHISEMLTARGGADETRVVWRWPIGRYER
ncbi:MAG: hypothetical protein RIS70_1954, partial [Planctomycetota bacterium]